MIKLRIDQIVAEWYALIALRLIAGQIVEPFNKRGERLIADIDDLKDALTDYMFEAFQEYLLVAVCREAAHSVTECSVHFMDAEKMEMLSWTSHEDFYRYVADTTKESVIGIGLKVFGSTNAIWTSNYGGKAWLNIVREGLLKVKTNPTQQEKELYVDHIVDMQHNTGTVLNKENPMFRLHDAAYFSDYLTFKRYASLEDVVWKSPSTEVKSIARRIVRMKYPNADREKEFAVDPSDEQFIKLAQIGWGKRVLRHNRVDGDNGGFVGFVYNPVDLYEAVKSFKAPEHGDNRIDDTLYESTLFCENGDYDDYHDGYEDIEDAYNDYYKDDESVTVFPSDPTIIAMPPSFSFERIVDRIMPLPF